MPREKIASDTVTVTPDGRTIVDMAKLLAKKHIRDMIREMRAKTTPRRQPSERPRHHSAAD